MVDVDDSDYLKDAEHGLGLHLEVDVPGAVLREVSLRQDMSSSLPTRVLPESKARSIAK